MPTNESIYLSLDGLTETELLDLKEETDLALASIKIQIEDAKARAAEGSYSNRDWWRRVNNARRIKGLQSQQIQRALGKLRREKKAKNQADLSIRFMDIARRDLPPELFHQILNKALEEE